MWDNTLLVFSADNGGPIYWGGIGGANNWPAMPPRLPSLLRTRIATLSSYGVRPDLASYQDHRTLLFAPSRRPLKGGKGSNWQGGVRVNSFVSGGE